MFRTILALALLVMLCLVPSSARAGDLTVRDVIELHRSGLGEEVLLALIEVDGGPFDLTHGQLLDLKAEGLSSRVLAALVRAGRSVHERAAVEAERASSHETHDWNSGHVDVGGGYVTHWPHRQQVVAVPVYITVPDSHDDPDPDSNADGTRSGRSSFGLGTAPAVRRRGAVTVDSIRHAPPGFHPGSIGARPKPSSSAEPSASSDGQASTAAAPPAPTPGFAGSSREPSASAPSSTSSDAKAPTPAPTPGFAGSYRPPAR